MRTITVVPYDPTWKIEFEKAKAFYQKTLNGLNIQIEHVGSTAVEGLYAKPIIDIDIVVPNKSVRDEVIKRLERAEYKHQGDLGIVGREAFKYEKSNPNITWMEHHLYVCMEGCESLVNHMMLRNHLRKNPEAVKAYSQIKLDLASAHPHDIDSYVEGKSELIGSFLAKEGMDVDALNRIESANKKDGDTLVD